jgi:putative DNA methylase
MLCNASESCLDMTGNYPKRLIEVDLPIKRISAHARREKSIRHGHISTLHIWWARRPLAACRAVVCASLWPDPADDLCPSQFVETSRQLMTYWGHNCLKKCSDESSFRFNKIVRSPECLNDGGELRKAMLDFIADFANWNNSTDAEYLAVARTLTVAAHDALEGLNGFDLPESISAENLNEAIKDAPRPLLVDPFAGGGAIPLEGLRCGADAFASDLQDIPVALNRIILEDLNETSDTITKDYLSWANKLNERVAEKLQKFYQSDKKSENIFAYFWARTVFCEGPGCGKKVPLIGNPHLSKREIAKASIVLRYPEGQKNPEVILSNYSKGDASPTVKGGNVICPCGYVTSVKSVRQQLSLKNGGADEAFLLAVGFIDDNGKKRYRLPSKLDLDSHERAIKERYLYSKKTDINSPLSPFPNEKLWGKSHMNVGLYGLIDWSHVFTSRQLILLRTYQEELSSLAKQEAGQLSRILISLLALTIDKIIDYSTSLTRWVPGGEFIAATLGSEKKLPMMWDFTECVSTGNGPGSWKSMTDWIARVIDHIKNSNLMKGTVIQCDARDSSLPSDSVQCLFTDPPYYDAIWYGDLSDLFTVWYRRTISLIGLPIESDEIYIKEAELIKSTFSVKDGLKNKDDAFYESGMRDSLRKGREVVQPSGLGIVVFAHKSTSGWESVLQATIDAGWTVTSSWPIDTEREARMTSIGQAALGSSIHIILRPREDKDGNVIEKIGDWRDVLSELPGRITAWLPRLASEGVVGADAIFACLGPALEIFSRYSSVEKASGEVVPLREYLEHVWAEVARQALNMIFEDADASGFEEDARLTAMWLWTLRTDANGNGTEDEKPVSLPGYTLEYDAARKIAQGLGCHLEHLTYLVEVKGSKAMLLSAESRARYLFGKQEVGMTSSRGKKKDSAVQLDLFSLAGSADEGETGGRQAELERPPAGKTILDQLHQAMLLFTAGRGAALKRFLVDDGIGSNPQFWTLAQALSALYPAHTNEKRWVDGVLARKKGLGF